MGLTGLAAARLLGLPTVAIYHTDFVQYVRYLTQDDDLADLTWKYMFWFYDQAHTILVPTRVLPPATDPQRLRAGEAPRHDPRRRCPHRFQPTKRDPAFSTATGSTGSLKFLYVGRVSREKDVDRLVDAFDRLRQRGHAASLAIVGDGPYRKELQARCQGRPIAFTGVLEGDDLAAAYASADVMVFPSTTDTFGNVVLEAQASGLPVIVSDLGGPAEIVRGHDSGIIVDHQEPDALVDAMERLYLSPEPPRRPAGPRASQRRRMHLGKGAGKPLDIRGRRGLPERRFRLPLSQRPHRPGRDCDGTGVRPG